MPLYDLQCGDCGREEERMIALVHFHVPIDCACGGTMTRIIRPPQVVSDIEPYQAMGTDIATGKAPMITSRSQHREYLKRNGYLEVGNEKPKPRIKPTVSDQEIARDVKNSIDKLGVRV